jgi:hypothetical protein
MSTEDNAHCPCHTFLEPMGKPVLQNFMDLVLNDNSLDRKYIQTLNTFKKSWQDSKVV